jgi:large subunit ribosomal protein L28
MARVCEKCGKGRQLGHQVSHSNVKTRKIWQPNLQKVRSTDEKGNTTQVTVCTRCIRSGRVSKPA